MIPEVYKHSVAINLSREMALDFGLVEPTPEEAEKRAQEAREHRAKARASWEVYDAARPALEALTDPIARKVLDLHAADSIEGPKCQGCDIDGYEAEQPEWPCATVELIADHYGIQLPDPWHLWRRPADEEVGA